MTLTQTVTFDDAANFTFDSNDIGVTTLAQLLLQFDDIADFSEDFADDTGFTYNNAKAEFVGGVVRQKDQTPTNSVFGATYTDDADASFPDLAATLNGLPTVSLGKMLCNGVEGAYYDSSIFSAISAGAIKFKYTPNYAVVPQNLNIVGIHSDDGSDADRLLLTHSPSGTSTLRITLNSSTTSLFVATTIGSTWTFTQDQEYEFELNFDPAAGTVRLFIDGVLHGTLTPGAWTRGTNANRLAVGASEEIYNKAQGTFDDVVVFNAVQHTSGYTPVYSIPEAKYAETFLTLPVFTYTGPGNIKPAGPPSSTETGAPRYIIQGFYHDGANWVASSDTYATASSKADIIANLGTFPDTGLSTITVDVVFPLSNTQSNVDQIDFSVQGELYAQDDPTIVSKTFTLLDAIESFTVDDSASGSDAVRYLLARYNAVGGTPTFLYWDGAAWSTSDGTYAQANTAADINANIASLDLSSGYYVRFFVFLHSADGTTTPTITSMEFDYSFHVIPSTPSKCIVYGWLRETDNTPFVGATVTCFNKTAFHNSGLLIPKSTVSTTTDSDGYWELELIETASVSHTYEFQFEYTDDKAKLTKFAGRIVPNQSTAAFENLSVA